AKVLLFNYVKRIAGSGLAFATYDGDLVAESKRYGTRILSDQAVVLGNHPAHVAEIEIANLDQLELDPSAPRHHAELVLVHSAKWLPVGKGVEYNCIVLAGYSARPLVYPKHLAEFDALLGKSDLGSGTTAFVRNV